MAANNSINISVDDGIPLDFLAEMQVAMNCLPVDEEEANRILAEKLRKEQQERNAERVRQFNNAWNIQPIDYEETTSNRIVQHHASSANLPHVKIPTRDPRIVARNTQFLLEDRPTYNPIAPLQLDEGHQLDAFIHERALAQLHASSTHDSSEVTALQEEQYDEPRRTERGRGPAPGQHTHDAGRTRTRARRSRRHSRTPSRSPSHRRRRKHARSRSRQRSPSYSRSRSGSRSSEHSHGTVDSRGRSSRKNNVDPTTMLQSMMAMTMQMFNQAGSLLNGQGNPMPLTNHVPPFTAVDAPLAGMIPEGGSLFTPAAFRNMFANQSNARTGLPAERANNASDMTTVIVEDDEEEQPNQPKYDVSTELFLEGKLSFTDFLSMKPSARSDQIAPVDPTVPKRIKEAITILEQQDTNKQSARFLYVPPTFYDNDTKVEHQRSPLVWNNQNVLFPLTSQAKETKQFQPFRNVNAKLKELIEKLGLDEGIVSQQLEKVMNAVAGEKNAKNQSVGTSDTLASSSRIEAITALSPKPGTGKVRHLIDRSVQTDGYACMQCVARNNKTFISTTTQTMAPVLRKDTEVQTNGPPMSAPNVISLDGLNANQIETVEAIVRFIRVRQLAGSIESVQHALRDERVTASTMTPAIQHSAHRLLSQVKSDMHRSEPYAGGGNSHSQYGNFQSSHSSSPYEMSRDQRFRHPGNGITRTFRTTTTTMAEQIIPAGLESYPAMSKKMKKKLKLQQHPQQQQRW
uniref:Uncharacterized protein n=1 Tax=Anopheles minimus TaxID=112268 RepID=A0A182VXV8_9DIPT